MSSRVTTEILVQEDSYLFTFSVAVFRPIAEKSSDNRYFVPGERRQNGRNS